MEIKLEDVKATMIRLQGQIDAWTSLYQTIEQDEKKKAAETSKKDIAANS